MPESRSREPDVEEENGTVEKKDASERIATLLTEFLDLLKPRARPKGQDRPAD
jgi:hypothetical protein